VKARYAKTLPKSANEHCTKCKKLFAPGTPVYHINNDSMGRENCKCITCYRNL